MTIRDLLELVSETRTVKIKPNGRRVYFWGSAVEVPEGLMGCEVTELAPTMDDEDNPILGVWVTADKDWDLLVDCFGKAENAVSAIYDSAYYQLIGDRESQEQEAQTIIQKNREERKNRYWMKSGQEKPEKIEWVQEAVSEADKQDVLDAENLRYLKAILDPIPDEVLMVDDGEPL